MSSTSLLYNRILLREVDYFFFFTTSSFFLLTSNLASKGKKKLGKDIFSLPHKGLVVSRVSIVIRFLAFSLEALVVSSRILVSSTK